MGGRKIEKDTTLLPKNMKRKKIKPQNKRPIFLRLSNLIEDDILSPKDKRLVKKMNKINHNPKKELFLSKKIKKRKKIGSNQGKKRRVITKQVELSHSGFFSNLVIRDETENEVNQRDLISEISDKDDNKCMESSWLIRNLMIGESLEKEIVKDKEIHIEIEEKKMEKLEEKIEIKPEIISKSPIVYPINIVFLMEENFYLEEGEIEIIKPIVKEIKKEIIKKIIKIEKKEIKKIKIVKKIKKKKVVSKKI